MLATLLTVLVTSVLPSQTVGKLTLCQLKIETTKTPSYFYMNNKQLESSILKIHILRENEDSCIVDLDKVVPKLTIGSYPMLEDIVVLCKEHQRIYFSKYEGQKANQIIIRLLIKQCTVDMNNLDNLLSIGDTRVLQIAGIIERGQKDNVVKEQNDPFRNIVSFCYFNYDTEEQNISIVLNENSSYPNLAEIALLHINLNSFPMNFTKVLPNLQSLEIPENDISLPPTVFPWKNDPVLLPKNLSRSPFMQSDYSDSTCIDIPNNVFRRYLNLNGNKVQNLSSYMFHGQIDKISIKSNGLHTIGSYTFRRIKMLQYLDLRYNIIADIPPDSFKGLTYLQKLGLSENKIQILHSGIFDNQISLKYLDLANNLLQTLPSKIFANLQKLEVLRLEQNRLSVLNSDFFPLDSVNLKEIHFQFNPIKTLPQFPFYLRGLRLSSFHATNITLINFDTLLQSFDHVKFFIALHNSGSDDELMKIDISDCTITTVEMPKNLTTRSKQVLSVLLRNFEFDLTNNPLKCNCEINSILHFVKENVDIKNGPNSLYPFKSWTCHFPLDFQERNMMVSPGWWGL